MSGQEGLVAAPPLVHIKRGSNGPENFREMSIESSDLLFFRHLKSLGMYKGYEIQKSGKKAY